MEIEELKKIVRRAEQALHTSQSTSSTNDFGIARASMEAQKSIAGSLLALSKLLVVVVEDDLNGKEK